jgi:hypothetical protein
VSQKRSKKKRRTPSYNRNHAANELPSMSKPVPGNDQEPQADAANATAQEPRYKKPVEIGTLVALCLTLIAAGIAAYEACRLVGVTEESERNQLRAYVDISDLTVVCPDCGKINFEPRYPPTAGQIFQDAVRINVRNGGETPARVLHVQINWQPEPKGNRLPDDFGWPNYFSNRIDNGGTIESRFTLGKDQSYSSESPIVTKTDFRIISSGANKVSSVYFYGFVAYCDIFKRAHRKLFCYYWQPGESPDAIVCD